MDKYYGGSSRMTKEDVYFDGLVDSQYELYDEDSQCLRKRNKKYTYDNINDIGWDSYDTYERKLRAKMKLIEEV